MTGLCRKHRRGIAALSLLSIVMASSVAFAGQAGSAPTPYPQEIDSVFRSFGFDSYKFVGFNEQFVAYEFQMPNGRSRYVPLHVAEELSGLDVEADLCGGQLDGTHPCVKLGLLIIAVVYYR